MIEIDDEDGRRTIPSVVTFVPSRDDGSLSRQFELSLPPWTAADEDGGAVSWPSPSGGDRYRIHVGKRAVDVEADHPRSTYRNVKRVIGTGGKMAELASGVVPNLFVRSVHGDDDEGEEELTSEDLDAIFAMLEEDDGRGSGKKKKKKKGGGKKKGKNKWQKRKQSELPKLAKQLEDAREDPALLTCDIAGVGNGGDAAGASSSSSELLLRPEQISACILRKLYDTAERRHAERDRDGAGAVRVTRAVIGVPAYFTDAQRQATIRASELAGVPKVKLLPEPEAAALAYGSASSGGGDDFGDKEELILVFDLGGGTFDVSVLEIGGGVTEVLATVGNNRLGGTDFDRRVAEYLSQSAVEHGRKRGADGSGSASEKTKRKSDDATGGKMRGRNRGPVKDWYRQGSGEVPDIILRVAEEARKCLSNQKVVEVLVPLTEGGWRRVGGNGDGDADLPIIGPFDVSELESEHGMVEGDDYITVSLDRTTFESICSNELRLLLQPIREVAIMAGVLLPGEARPSFVENAIAMAAAREEAMMAEGYYGEEGDFWDLEDEYEDGEEDAALTKTGGAASDDADPSEVLNDQALQQIQLMDIKAQKKAQQRGRKKARDIDKRERSFRKQKQSAMEEATTASLLGKQVGGGKRRRGGSADPASLASSVSVGNERVQEGIHGRPLSRVVLVGGATRMPVIAKILEAVVGIVPQRTVHPDEAVALGCAVQVGILDGENEGLLGGMQAVLSPMQAAVMRALAKKRGMELAEDGQLTMDSGSGGEMEMMMAGGVSGMMIVDEFDDEDDFY